LWDSSILEDTHKTVLMTIAKDDKITSAVVNPSKKAIDDFIKSRGEATSVISKSSPKNPPSKPKAAAKPKARKSARRNEEEPGQPSKKTRSAEKKEQAKTDKAPSDDVEMLKQDAGKDKEAPSKPKDTTTEKKQNNAKLPKQGSEGDKETLSKPKESAKKKQKKAKVGESPVKAPTEKSLPSKSASRKRSLSITDKEVSAPVSSSKSKDSDKNTKKKKSSKIKDPNAPKRSLTSYLLYCGDNRASVKKENPDAKFLDIGKILGEQFKSLSKKEKDVYVEKAALLKKTYDEEKIEYLKNKDKETKNEDETAVASEEPVATVVKKPRGQKKGKELTESKDDDNEEDVENNGPDNAKGKKAKTAKKAKKAKKDPNAPKRSLTTYMLFCKDHRAQVMKENPGKQVPEIGKTLGSMYKKLSLKEKDPYVKEAQNLKEQYDKDKAEYLKTKDTEEKGASGKAST
jgi:hypothetical protein